VHSQGLALIAQMAIGRLESGDAATADWAIEASKMLRSLLWRRALTLLQAGFAENGPTS
jgi:hypothetical protein